MPHHSKTSEGIRERDWTDFMIWTKPELHKLQGCKMSSRPLTPRLDLTLTLTSKPAKSDSFHYIDADQGEKNQ